MYKTIYGGSRIKKIIIFKCHIYIYYLSNIWRKIIKYRKAKKKKIKIT